MTVNNLTTIHPRLPHLVLTTRSIDTVMGWYCNALGMSLVHRTEATGDHKDEQALKAAWLTNDGTDHRLVLLELPDLEADPDNENLFGAQPQRPQRFSFTYLRLDELLDTYEHLKKHGILPVLCVDAGAQTSFYYKDPDHNNVELNVDNRGDSRASDGHRLPSPEFAKKMIGHHVDPDQLIAARATRRPSLVSGRESTSL
jgi:catechol 2,3-dioxygenase